MGNWLVVAAKVGKTSCCSVAMIRRMEMVLAASVGGKSEFVGATAADNSDRVVEPGTSSEVAAMAASSWRDVIAVMTARGNSVAEETVVRTRWVVEAKVESSS